MDLNRFEEKGFWKIAICVCLVIQKVFLISRLSLAINFWKLFLRVKIQKRTSINTNFNIKIILKREIILNIYH